MQTLACAVTQGPALQRTLCLVSCSVVTIFELLIILKGAPKVCCQGKELLQEVDKG